MMHILYVDGEIGCLETGKKALEAGRHFSVETTPSAAEALEWMAVKDYNAILASHTMRQMDAGAFIRSLRSVNQRILLIFFMAEAGEETAVRVMDAGADLCLPKEADNAAQFVRVESLIVKMIEKKREQYHPDNGDVVFNAMDEMVLITDPSGTILRANAAATRLLRYSEDELLGMNVAMLHPLDQREDSQRIFAGMVDGTMNSCPVPVLTKDGRTIPVETRVSRGWWNNREVLIGVSRNISERIEAEAALRQSEYLFRVVLNNANDGIFLLERTTDGPGRYLLVNDTAVRMLGYSKYELLKMSPRDIVPEYIRKNVMPKIIGKLNRDRYATFESVHVRKDGSSYPVEVSTYTFRLGGKDVDLSVTRDITERKRAEEAIKKSEEYLRVLIATTADILWETDNGARFVYISPQVEKILGYHPDELIGKTPFEFLEPASVGENREAFRKASVAPGGYLSHKSCWVHKGGQRVILESRAIPIIDTDGAVAGFRGIDRWTRW